MLDVVSEVRGTLVLVVSLTRPPSRVFRKELSYRVSVCCSGSSADGDVLEAAVAVAAVPSGEVEVEATGAG